MRSVRLGSARHVSLYLWSKPEFLGLLD